MKVVLLSESKKIEFDVYFEGITALNMDATVNWHYYDIDPRGVFYTDENALYMVRRETDSYRS